MFDHTMRFGLGEEIDALREMVRRIAAEEIAPRAAEIDASNEFPMDLWEKMGALGLHAITVPEEDGGRIDDYPDQGIEDWHKALGLYQD